jgi:hypothetical protein
MSKPIDLTADDYERQRPRSYAELAHDDQAGNVGYTPDPGPQPPGPNSSAAQLVSRAMKRRAEVVKERQLQRLGHLAAQDEEDAALERAKELLRKGGEPGRRTRDLAMRALERQGGDGLSSADQHAANYFRRHGWQQQTNPTEPDFDYTV